MKTPLLYSICFAISFGAAGQTETGNEKRGAKLFDQFDYIASVETLEAVDHKSVDVLRELAESYDMIGNYAKSETYLAQICTSADRVPNDHLNYARVLMKNQKYNEAEMQLKIYGTLNPENEEAARFQLLNESVQKFTQYGANFSVQSMSMNSDQEDFAPVMYENQLYFASSRYKHKSVWRRWSGNHLSFLDICVAEINQDNVSKWWLFDNKEINKRYHEGPVAFSPNGNELYITRNNYDGTGPDGTRQLQLLVSTKTGTTWSEPAKLPFNSNDFSVGHATLSPDGNIMVFASDMPGGKGGVDLYKTVRKSGIWSTPENLSKINTTGDEMFPYLHAGGVLIFSSNGHPGYGGLDLYVGQWKNDNVARFQNLGSPMNSPSDDFSVWLNPEMSHGYFASNRTGGMGNDDLYSFSMKNPFAFGRTIKGIAKDQAGNLLPGAKVVVSDNAGNAVAEVITDVQGEFVFETDKTGNFNFLGTKEKYFDGTSLLSINDESPVDLEQEVVLEKDPGFALLATITDKQSKAVLDSVKVLLINNLSGEQEVVYTNEKGEIFRPIRDRKINDRISYNIRLEKNGYISKGTTYNRVLDKEGKYVVSDEMNLSMDKMDVGLDLAKVADLKPIFFDVGKFNIRPDAAIELDKIVKVMNDYPTMVVELGSHTDCRGTAPKNQELSQKRAMASAEYIKARIVSNPNRIYGMGYGESKLLNGCACEGKNNPKYTEAQHQVNRRTEFLVVKF